MVVLHAEFDPVSGDRVKTALGAMSSKMLIDDTAYDPIRTFEQRNADALVALITQQPADSASLVLLCPRCHTKVHKHGHTIENDTETGRYRLQPPPRPSPTAHPPPTGQRTAA